MIRIAIIGTGGMAHAHAGNFSKIKGVQLAACCDINAERAAAFAQKWNIPRHYTDYNALLDNEKIDGVSNVTTDKMHTPVALAVLARKLHILSEKPLAASLPEAERMAAAAKKAGVVNMVNFSYRNSAGLLAAARWVQSGGIGRIVHVESSYLQSWLVGMAWGNWKTSPAWAWRLSTRHGSAGTLGDIGCHIYDLTGLLAGDFASIDCRLKTFSKGMPGNRLGEYVLDANDSFVSTIEFKNGALGTIHSSRWAVGHLNSLRARVYGDQGAVEIDLDKSYTEYRMVSGKKSINKAEWKTVVCKPIPNLHQRFITAIRTGKNDPSDFANGLKVQQYLHYSFVSDKKRGPVKIG
jgi:predicted dehydrogenase